MRGKNRVQVSVTPNSMQSGDLSPEVFPRHDHHQYSSRNHRAMVMKQPQAWSATSSAQDLIEQARSRRTKHAKTIDPPKNSTCLKVALIILGVVIAVIAVVGMALGIYAVITVQQATASNATATATTATTTTASTTTTVLPAQCFVYTIINDATRLTTYSATTSGTDTGYATYPTWVRFFGQGGTQLATSAPSANRCGGMYPAWYTDALPGHGSTVVGAVCYVWSTSYCVYSNLIPVTNCGSFYVYGLIGSPVSYGRYCTI